MRLIGWQVCPVVMADDGDDLTSVQIQPHVVPAKDWQAFKDGGDAQALESVRQQVEGAASRNGAGGQAPPVPSHRTVAPGTLLPETRQGEPDGQRNV